MDVEVLDPVSDTEAAKVPHPSMVYADIPLGITRNLENDAYHGESSAVSSTQLKRMLISAAHFASGFEEPEESSEALLFGSVLHGRLLEPATFAGRFFGMPKVDRRTKAGKALAESLEKEAAGRARFPEDWLSAIDRIVANARAHRRVRRLLSAGEAEVALSWIDPETGVKCKIKIDWWHDLRSLADVKSAADITRDGFGKACARLHYPLSAAMYCEGVYQVTGEEPEWTFIACEKTAPHTVAAYDATEAFLHCGRQKLRTALRRLAECRAKGVFPMLQGEGDSEPIDVPPWY